jgi:hypothetical protein
VTFVARQLRPSFVDHIEAGSGPTGRDIESEARNALYAPCSWPSHASLGRDVTLRDRRSGGTVAFLQVHPKRPEVSRTRLVRVEQWACSVGVTHLLLRGEV